MADNFGTAVAELTDHLDSQIGAQGKASDGYLASDLPIPQRVNHREDVVAATAVIGAAREPPTRTAATLIDTRASNASRNEVRPRRSEP